MTLPEGRREQKKARTRSALSRAALSLFSEHGYDRVTMDQVAAAADVAPRTLFRYFRDKEELLFDDDELVADHLRTAVPSAPPGTGPHRAAREALLELLPLWSTRRDEGRVRLEVIDSSVALHGRARVKLAAHEQVLCEALCSRGLPRPQGRLVARIMVACFDEGVRRWLLGEHPGPLDASVRGAFDEADRNVAPG